jgi:hypothetical protein
VTLHSFDETNTMASTCFVYPFTKKYGDNLKETIAILQNILTIISQSENDSLTREIIKEDILKAIWDLAPKKSPGPNGFSIHFYKECYNIIKFDLIHMLQYVHKYNKIGEFNVSFLALIPKGDHPFSSKFIPLSLCNSYYKIMTKIISNRLKNILSRII